MILSVIGIGQSLRGDDGAGPETVRCWRQEFATTASDPRIQIHLMETPGLDLLNFLDGVDAAILVDAVCTGNTPGTVLAISPIPESGLSAAEKTAHGFGVAETLALARKVGTGLPERLILIGIEGKQYELGRGLSDSVRAALPAAAEKIQEIVSNLISTKSTKKI